MNNNLKEVSKGKVVNKAHTLNTGVDEFSRYVLEYEAGINPTDVILNRVS